jgi:CelD/BcsL family acetyltransferase involved in cellulose biosynthesis
MSPAFAFTTGRLALRVFDEDWDDLASRNPNFKPFQSSWWCKSWCQNVAETAGFTPVVAKAIDGGLEVGCAFAVCEREGRVTANSLGVGWCDYYDAVGPDCSEAVTLLARLLEKLASWHVIDLTDVFPNGLITRAASLLAVEPERSTPCYVIDTTDMWWVDKITSRRSHAIRRRRLERLGEVRMVNYTSADAIRERLPEFISIHRAAWDHNPDTFAPFGDGVTDRMFYSMADSGGAVGQVVLSSLQLDGRPLAMYFGLKSPSWYGSYRITYDVTRKKYSPGHLLLAQMIQDFAQDGCTEFDLMRGAHPYKLDYASQVRWNHRVTLS